MAVLSSAPYVLEVPDELLHALAEKADADGTTLGQELDAAISAYLAPKPKKAAAKGKA